uniref:Uncharacterized protein n=1 Tax=viral metagenome TaxID=1070528 RepID=A0A6M3LP83_9ZZZZ
MKSGDELIAEINFENALRQRQEMRRQYIALQILKYAYEQHDKYDNLDLWIWAKEGRN